MLSSTRAVEALTQHNQPAEETSCGTAAGGLTSLETGQWQLQLPPHTHLLGCQLFLHGAWLLPLCKVYNPLPFTQIRNRVPEEPSPCPRPTNGREPPPPPPPELGLCTSQCAFHHDPTSLISQVAWSQVVPLCPPLPPLKCKSCTPRSLKPPSALIPQARSK